MMLAHFFRIVLVTSLCVALIAVAFAHQNEREISSGPELALFIASGGTLSDLCGTGDENGDHFESACEACRIHDNLVFLRGSDDWVPAKTGRNFVFAFVAKRLAQTKPLDPTRLTRAPPQA